MGLMDIGEMERKKKKKLDITNNVLSSAKRLKGRPSMGETQASPVERKVENPFERKEEKKIPRVAN